MDSAVNGQESRFKVVDMGHLRSALRVTWMTDGPVKKYEDSAV